MSIVPGNRLNSPWVTTFVVGIMYLAFLILQLNKSEWDFSTFITSGDQFVNRASAPAGLSVIEDSAGYDGQFYYRLALTPFTDEKTDFGISLDNPPFRQQRIVYPLLARSLSIGRIDAFPFSLVFANFLALCSIGWLGARYAQVRGQHAFWGFAFALYPGFLLTLSRDTPEIIAALLMLAGIFYLTLRRRLLACVFLIFAILTKETALVLSFGLLATALPYPGHWKNTQLAIAVSSILAYVLWQFWLASNWSLSFSLGGSLATVIGPPILGIGQFLVSIIPPEIRSHHIWFLELVLLAGSTLVVVFLIFMSKTPTYIKFS